jgi:polar amino acid transport system permease protein
MTPAVTRRRVVWPLALRAIIPSLGNEFINLIKSTSLVSVVGASDLMQRSTELVSQSFDFFPVLLASGLMYLALTSGASALQLLWERHTSYERRTKAAEPTLDVGDVVALSERPPLFAQARESAAGDRTLLLCQDVRKSYGGKAVLDGVNLKVGKGEVLALLGGSGSGKSTLLRMINHLEPMDSGTITVAGGRVGYATTGDPEQSPKRLAQARADARIGMVFQHFNLFPHMTALQNVMAAPVHVYGQDKPAARRLALQMLDVVDLADHAGKLPQQLSGGQQQRVAIARALATKPQLMLFDEPTSALDPELVSEVLVVMRNLAADGMTMVVVTHELRFARDVADRAIFLEGGRIVEDAPARDLLTAPREPQTQRFLASLVGLPT